MGLSRGRQRGGDAGESAMASLSWDRAQSRAGSPALSRGSGARQRSAHFSGTNAKTVYRIDTSRSWVSAASATVLHRNRDCLRLRQSKALCGESGMYRTSADRAHRRPMASAASAQGSYARHHSEPNWLARPSMAVSTNAVRGWHLLAACGLDIVTIVSVARGNNAHSDDRPHPVPPWAATCCMLVHCAWPEDCGRSWRCRHLPRAPAGDPSPIPVSRHLGELRDLTC